jgi:hypothetical protein
MNQRGKKAVSRPGVNISFSELVQRIAQRDTKGVEQKLEDPKQKRAKPKLPRRQKK